jgi:ankyrin repeat protein
MKILAKASPEALSKRSFNGRTALHFAWDELESTEWLLEQKLDKDATDKSNETALFLAAQGGYSRIVGILLEHGADLKVANDEKKTALHAAAYHGKEEVAEMIGKKLRADIAKAKDESSKQLIADLVNAKDEYGYSPLQLAVRGNEVDCAIALLQYPGIDIDIRDREGKNPLMLAIQKTEGLSSAIVRLVESFEKSKANDEKSTTKKGIHACDRQGRTVLHIAAACKTYELFDSLVGFGAAKEAKDIQGRTVFHHATIGRNTNVLEMLLRDDSLKDLNVKDKHGWSPLHWACRVQGRDTRTVELLLEGRNVIAERSQPSVDGWTPENIAIFHSARAITSILRKPAKYAAEGLEADDSLRNESQQAQKKWKVGQRHTGVGCDGCGLYVSFIHPF